MHQVPSPNTNARVGVSAPDMAVVHYTEMASARAAIEWLCNPASRVSAHYLIAADGTVSQMVDEAERAWHAGVSAWAGSNADLNSRSIGIELDSPGHAPDAPTFAAPQIDALLRLLDAIRARWPIPRRNVVAHSDIAPMRKIDPGERFPWRRLAEAGHALWVPGEQTPALVKESVGEGERQRYLALLAECGYVPDAASFDALSAAFHRRHLPQRSCAGAPHAALTAAALATAERLAQATRSDKAADP